MLPVNFVTSIPHLHTKVKPQRTCSRHEFNVRSSSRTVIVFQEMFSSVEPSQLGRIIQDTTSPLFPSIRLSVDGVRGVAEKWGLICHLHRSCMTCPRPPTILLLFDPRPPFTLQQSDCQTEYIIHHCIGSKRLSAPPQDSRFPTESQCQLPPPHPPELFCRHLMTGQVQHCTFGNIANFGQKDSPPPADLLAV